MQGARIEIQVLKKKFHTHIAYIKYYYYDSQQKKSTVIIVGIDYRINEYKINWFLFVIVAMRFVRHEY